MYTIKDKTFKTKKDIRNYVALIKDEKPLSTESQEFIKSLAIKARPEHYNWLITTACKRIVISKNPSKLAKYSNTKVFKAQHISKFRTLNISDIITSLSSDDATPTEVSQKSQKQSYSSIISTFRFTVRKQMLSQRRAHYALQATLHPDKVNTSSKGCAYCEITHQYMSKRDLHLDHHPISFKEILSSFLKEYYQITLKDLQENPDNYPQFAFRKNKRSHPYFIDSLVGKKWYYWHLNKAKYRLISKKENLTKSKSL